MRRILSPKKDYGKHINIDFYLLSLFIVLLQVVSTKQLPVRLLCIIFTLNFHTPLLLGKFIFPSDTTAQTSIWGTLKSGMLSVVLPYLT